MNDLKFYETTYVNNLLLVEDNCLNPNGAFMKETEKRLKEAKKKVCFKCGKKDDFFHLNVFIDKSLNEKTIRVCKNCYNEI